MDTQVIKEGKPDDETLTGARSAFETAAGCAFGTTLDVVMDNDLKAGEHCPQCQEGILDYDGILNLGCARCGFVLAGCFT